LSRDSPRQQSQERRLVPEMKKKSIVSIISRITKKWLSKEDEDGARRNSRQKGAGEAMLQLDITQCVQKPPRAPS